MKNSVLPVLLVALAFLLTACTPSRPRGILSKSKMTDVLVDYHLAQGMAEAGDNVDVMRYKYVQAVFRKHHISEAEFDSSMIYYSGRAEIFSDIYEKVTTRVQAEAERMGSLTAESSDQFASLTADGDTANVWLGKDFACIVANPVQCVYSFQMKADSTFRTGDKFIWRFQSQFVGRSMNNEAIALLTFYYERDTVCSVTELLRGRFRTEMRHTPGRGLDSLRLQRIAGFIYLPLPHDGEQPKPLLVSGLQLIRMHAPQASKPQDVTAAQPLAPADSLQSDTVADKASERLSPLQVRESQPKKRTIHVTKENPNPIHPERGIPERSNRRRR